MVARSPHKIPAPVKICTDTHDGLRLGIRSVNVAYIRQVTVCLSTTGNVGQTHAPVLEKREVETPPRVASPNQTMGSPQTTYVIYMWNKDNRGDGET